VEKFFGRFSRFAMALVCGGFSAVVLALCLFGGAHFKNRIEQEYYRETENIAQVLMASFEDDAANLDAILTRLATQISTADLTADNETQLHEILVRYALQPSVIGPATLDRNGALVASARANPTPRITMSDRSLFRFHADNPGESHLYISAPTRGLLTNEWSIQFSRPLHDASGAFNGVVIASYRLSHFVDLYEKLKISNRGLAGLTGNDGIVRIRTLSGTIDYGASVTKIAPVYERVLAGEKSGTFHARSVSDGVLRTGSFVASKTTPFYVTVGYDDDYISSRYIGFFYILGLCWFVVTAAMVAVVIFVRRMEKIGQRNQLDIVNSAIAERQKISADMHDSIGASLATLLAHFISDSVNLADVKRRIGEILMELRFLVDSAEPVDGELNVVLSNVRHRMGSGIELAGIKLRWQVAELPRLPGLSARDALSIRLIMMEALSNVLHHSKAKSVALTAAYNVQAATIVIEIKDDGCGFDAGNQAKAGRGISNMRKRIRAISTGTLAIESSPGHGTTIRIELAVPANSTNGAPAQRDDAA
jgi:signal transduction histidine kinase